MPLLSSYLFAWVASFSSPYFLVDLGASFSYGNSSKEEISMKTNLDKLFKNNPKHENDGIWLNISEETGFLVKRFGGDNSNQVKAALALYYKPYARLIEMGTMDPKKEREIMLKVFINSCLIDWKGVEIDGSPAEFSKEAALAFLLELPELAETLMAYASDSKNYREELGNF